MHLLGGLQKSLTYVAFYIILFIIITNRLTSTTSAAGGSWYVVRTCLDSATYFGPAGFQCLATLFLTGIFVSGVVNTVDLTSSAF